MAPPNPKRPPRPRIPTPDDNETSDEGELPFDERDATPLRADDPKPQRVTTYPVTRAGRGRSRARDTALAGGFASANAPAPDSAEVFLYAERGPGAGQLLPIAPGSLVLGRSSSADLRLPHASISRRHARLQRRGERFFLEDLGSQNGTYLDEERLSAEREILPGQRIHIGPAILRLRRPGAPDAPVEELDAGPEAWTPGLARQRLWQVAVLAGAAGFLLAALLALGLAHYQSSPPAQKAEPAAQAR
jgi:hypothetical protein